MTDDHDDPKSTTVMAFDVEAAVRAVSGGLVELERGAVLGIGGTAVVYRAREPSLGREVAMKVKNAATPPERFLAEARITAQLDHPFIPPVHRLGVDGTGAPCFVMRLVAGQTFGELAASLSAASTLNRLRDLVRVLIKVCDALSHAHGRGVVHCDITPGNVMIGEHGDVQVMDWGIARSRESIEGGPPSGTPSFMSPEQALTPDDVDHRVDVWGVGALLYFALTGRGPRTSADPAELVSDVVPPEHIDPKLPRALCAAAMRALSRDRGTRHTSIDELRADLVAWLEGGHLFETRVVPAGTVIVREGDVGDEAFVIVNGRCHAYRADRVLATMGPGDVFGEAAAFGDRVRTASVSAIDDCTFMVFRADDLLDEVSTGSPLRAFVSSLAKRFRAAEARAEAAEARLRGDG